MYIAAGVALLTAGGELLIRGALGAAGRLGVSPLLSGLLIVGFGTSAPELLVSVDAALEQRPDIARHLGATHVWVPHGATGTARLRAQLEATPGFAMVARAGSGVVYAFTPPPQTPGALAVGTAQVVAQQ